MTRNYSRWFSVLGITCREIGSSPKLRFYQYVVPLENAPQFRW